MLDLLPATRPTMHFIGVTTARSSIMQIFPVWARELGIEGVLSGIDFRPGADPHLYRAAVAHIKLDPLSLGALVTTHKVNLFRAAQDLFDEVDTCARTLHEVSCLSKCDGRLVGHAMDPITVGQALEALVPPGRWRDTPGDVLILGSGGSALALTLHLHHRAQAGDGPRSLVVVAIDPESLAEMRAIHQQINLAIPVTYRLTTSLAESDSIVASLAQGSLIVNATGLGKDGPGSPTSDAVRYPEGSSVWEFNYRGELSFLHQAREQEIARGLTVVDGWKYFIVSWTRVIGQVFDIDIPAAGPVFERLSQLAIDLRV